MNRAVLQLLTNHSEPSVHYRNTEWLRTLLDQARRLDAFAAYTDSRHQSTLIFSTGLLQISNILDDFFDGTFNMREDMKSFLSPNQLALATPNVVSRDNLPANHLFAYSYIPYSGDTVFVTNYQFVAHPYYGYFLNKNKPLSDYVLEYRTSVDEWISRCLRKLHQPKVILDYRKGIDVFNAMNFEQTVLPDSFDISSLSLSRI
jgi:hypothetical protein